MKPILSFILLLATYAASAQQQQEIIRLDSCKQFGEKIFDDIYIRVQQTAQWKNKKTSLDDYFDQFFKDYVQKKAGGKITLSLLITAEGKVCLYEARPNSNVRPNYTELKTHLNRQDWIPASVNGKAVVSIKILQVVFDGKKISVTELE